VVVVVSIGVVLGVVWRCWGKFLLVCVAYVLGRWWVLWIFLCTNVYN